MQSNVVPVFCLLAALMCTQANATPFLIYDARSLGMGSIGVASGSRYSQFNNPALLPFEIPFVAWHFSIGGGQFTTDPDDFEKGFKEFQSAINVNIAQTELLKLADQKFDEIVVKSVAVSIPSKVLGGAVFLNKYVIKSVMANVGAIDISDPLMPEYNSTLEKRGLSVVEQGISFAQIFKEGEGGVDTWSIGLSPKLVLAKTSSASEDIVNTNIGISFSGVTTESAFNIDVGIFRELGRYKMGAVLKNIVPMEFKFTDGQVIKIKPQLKAGLGYAKRKSSWEINLDLTPNDGMVFTNESAYLSMGTEYILSRVLRLRAGYRQNLLEDNDATLSIGIGVGFTLRIDIGAFKGDDEVGVIGQIGADF